MTTDSRLSTTWNSGDRVRVTGYHEPGTVIDYMRSTGRTQVLLDDGRMIVAQDFRLSVDPEPGAENVRSWVLRIADELVNGDRNVQYGDPKADFKRTASMWSAYLGVEVEPHDVAAMMALLKVSRIRWSPTKADHWHDLAGYAACGADCALEGKVPGGGR